MTKILYCLALAIVGLAITAAVLSGWITATAFRAELVEVGLQVLVFGLAGGLIKLLLDHAAARRDFSNEMLRRLGRAHKVVYRARRLLAAVEDEQRLRLLGELMDTRQDLGDVGHEIRNRSLLKTRKAIQAEIDAMRAYLEEVIVAALSDDTAGGSAYAEFVNYAGAGAGYQARFKRHYLAAKQLAAQGMAAG